MKGRDIVLRMYRLKKALTIVFIVALVLLVLFMIYSYMKDSAAMDGYEFNPFHTKHDYHYDYDYRGHTKIYSCGCYNTKVYSPHKYIKISKNKQICEYCGYCDTPYYTIY